MYRFEHINALYLLAGNIIIILLYFFYNQWKNKRLKILAESHLHDRIIEYRSKSKPKVKLAVYIIIYSLLVLSLANLQIGGKIDKQASSRTIDMILAVDISHSMLAEDVRPSRIERAKMFCKKLSEKVTFAKTGIVLFAGDAFIHLPITSDPGAVRMFISSITTDLLSVQGTAIGKALTVAADAFQRTKTKNKAVILISDGENFEDDAIQAAQIAKKESIVIHTVAIGTPEGAPIPLKKDGKTIGFKKDRNDNTVITKPDFFLLAQIAKETGGISVDGNQPGEAVDALVDALESLERAESEGIQFADWDSLFHLFAFPALFLLFLDFIVIERKMKWQNYIESLFKLSLIQKQNKQ